ncbi:hypothetical protein ACFXJ5_04560 [Streptomyces sp. NPDC059373]
MFGVTDADLGLALRNQLPPGHSETLALARVRIPPPELPQARDYFPSRMLCAASPWAPRADHSPDRLFSPRRVARAAAVAENAGFTLITLDDSVLPPAASPDPVGRIGAVERAAFVAASTSAIGIAPVVPVRSADPRGEAPKVRTGTRRVAPCRTCSLGRSGPGFHTTWEPQRHTIEQDDGARVAERLHPRARFYSPRQTPIDIEDAQFTWQAEPERTRYERTEGPFEAKVKGQIRGWTERDAGGTDEQRCDHRE